jgi:threonylcarbamoyladenosine tRNA methylthiotransferase MtaB
MKKVALETIGCRLNQYETERMAARLAACGLERVPFEDAADLYIINTCTVTGRADASCRRAISKASKRHDQARIVVVGCYVTAEREVVANLNGVDLVIDNEEKEEISGILRKNFPELFENIAEPVPASLLSDFHRHNRAWVKVGDGCNQNCSFCIVPIVRGRLVNRPPEEIIAEIKQLVSHGYQEIVLTGVHLGQYRYDRIDSPAELIRYILAETPLARLRLSSIEPQEVSSELIAAMVDGEYRVCRHLHIPLQSGSDTVLKKMRRPYDIQSYLEKLHLARGAIGRIVIGADVIVGFPGETEDDFQQTIEVVQSGLIDYLHVFSYSDRSGTVAATLPGKIHSRVIKARNEILHGISVEQYAKALKREIGETAYAISEHRAEEGNHFWGITDNYLKVTLPSGCGGTKEIIKMKIAGATDRHLFGEVLS